MPCGLTPLPAPPHRCSPQPHPCPDPYLSLPARAPQATAALDAESEAALLAALDAMARGRTVISIAHRLSTIRHSGTVALLAGGRVAETGPFDALFADERSAFRGLIRRQAADAPSPVPPVPAPALA